MLVGAGNETTRNLITGAVLAFAEFPGEWDRLAADPALVDPRRYYRDGTPLP